MCPHISRREAYIPVVYPSGGEERKTARMPGKGKSQHHGESKPKVRHIKAKHQKKRFIRSKDPILAVFMWGVQHSVSSGSPSWCLCLYMQVDLSGGQLGGLKGALSLLSHKVNLSGYLKICSSPFHNLCCIFCC